ncbi:HET-domain-containing protein [Delitschia confertaspora ATCC 74209]|uniref:HET-domain-containing protein n=1 Tax=Delitschia confertaspora ATCC 74209 TaxID=1513339 RepID=A0A9P4JEV4_9PLEO|nr:HET-domain-containing protein [Delitschia confertaspora ATCC 74209]
MAEEDEHINRRLVQTQEKVDDTLCRICRTLLEVAQGPDISDGTLHQVTLGTLKELLEIECDQHEPILDLVSKYLQELDERSEDASVYASKSAGQISVGSDFAGEPRFYVLENQDGVDGRWVPKIGHPQWVDHNLFPSWKETCLNDHNVSCGGETSGDDPRFAKRPSLFIDVKGMCLVHAGPKDPYVALSYVWGNVQTLQTVKENVSLLKRKQAISAAINNSEIPKTIVHAIEITRILKERYLWVDALCIVQDGDEKLDEISNMASIYANSVVTIIAAEGKSAQDGIRGIRNLSEPRKYKQRVTIDLGKGFQLVENLWSLLPKTTWSSRGWTFQEAAFSPRQLIFGDHVVHWRCDCAMWLEACDAESDKRLSRFEMWARDDPRWIRQQEVIRRPFPTLHTYGYIVEGFTKRYFTYAKDAIFGFAGIASILGQGFDGGFLYGLPETLFDVALLWQPDSVLERRLPANSLSDWQAPSWSWMGWRGDIFCLPKELDYHTGYKPATPRTIATVKWYTATVATDGHKKRRIFATTQHYSQTHFDENTPVALGWTHLCKVSPESGPGQSEKEHAQQYFTYEGLPSYKFLYPFPLKNTRAPAGLARLWVGLLHIQDEDTAMALPSKLDPPTSWRGVELISISLGNFGNYWTNFGRAFPEEFNHPERPKEGELYEYHNVLWIEWDSGVAYRKGLGRVVKAVWESEEREWIDVTLG